MSRNLFILVVSLLFSFVSIEPATAQALPEDDLTIDIRPQRPKLPGTTPLSLIDDIEASYYNGALTLVFNVDLGNADITVTNLSTGDIWWDSVSGMGTTTIMLSGDEGYHEILIHTDNGDYSGEFTI